MNSIPNFYEQSRSTFGVVGAVILLVAQGKQGIRGTCD